MTEFDSNALIAFALAVFGATAYLLIGAYIKIQRQKKQNDAKKRK